jgi:membrane-associated phospholipid phosphatase
VLAGALKHVVVRPRPPGFIISPSDIFPSVNQYAYPSGHVLFFVVFFGFVAYLGWKFLAGLTRRILVYTCAILIVLIGSSRIYAPPVERVAGEEVRSFTVNFCRARE